MKLNIVLLLLLTFSFKAFSIEKEVQECIHKMLAPSIDSDYIDYLAKECRKHKKDEDIKYSAMEMRLLQERLSNYNPYIIQPHKPNYILPLTYMKHVNKEPYQLGQDEDYLDSEEIKFQLSIKFPILPEDYERKWDLFFAYTHLSFWQAYNKDFSSPFRETNYAPEIFWAWGVGQKESTLVCLV